MNNRPGDKTDNFGWNKNTDVRMSGLFVAEISIKSLWKLFMFTTIYKKKLWIKVSQKQLILL